MRELQQEFFKNLYDKSESFLEQVTEQITRREEANPIFADR